MRCSSEVTFDAEVTCTHSSVRLRPTVTKKRSSGSSYTSTSSSAGVPTS